MIFNQANPYPIRFHTLTVATVACRGNILIQLEYFKNYFKLDYLCLPFFSQSLPCRFLVLQKFHPRFFFVFYPLLANPYFHFSPVSIPSQKIFKLQPLDSFTWFPQFSSSFIPVSSQTLSVIIINHRSFLQSHFKSYRDHPRFTIPISEEIEQKPHRPLIHSLSLNQSLTGPLKRKSSLELSTLANYVFKSCSGVELVYFGTAFIGLT